MVATNRLEEGQTSLAAVRIELRLPAPWGSPAELSDALEKAEVGYRLNESGRLVRESDGWSCDVGASPHDDDIAGIFAADGRLSKQEVKAVAGHVAKVHLGAPGGSVKHA